MTMFWHNRHGESQVIIVIGMVLMLIAGVVVDRMFLLEVLPTSHIREFLHLQATESAPLTPVASTPQGQGTFTTTPKAPSRAAPWYAGSAGAKIGDAVEMVSGPTFSSGYITGVIRNKSGKQLGLVRVDFALYDASGNNVDTAADMFGPLGVGETWRYKTGIYDSDVTSYKLVNFEAY